MSCQFVTAIGCGYPVSFFLTDKTSVSYQYPQKILVSFVGDRELMTVKIVYKTLGNCEDI